jgi:hypothetical protein
MVSGSALATPLVLVEPNEWTKEFYVHLVDERTVELMPLKRKLRLWSLLPDSRF